MKKVIVPEIVRKKCAESYEGKKEHALCERISLSSKATTLMLQDISGGKITSAFETPDQSIVTEMSSQHPENQCRLDTMFQGALCQAPSEIQFNDNDEYQGACTGTKVGARPLCWFHSRTSVNILN